MFAISDYTQPVNAKPYETIPMAWRKGWFGTLVTQARVAY